MRGLRLVWAALALLWLTATSAVAQPPMGFQFQAGSGGANGAVVAFWSNNAVAGAVVAPSGISCANVPVNLYLDGLTGIFGSTTTNSSCLFSIPTRTAALGYNHAWIATAQLPVSLVGSFASPAFGVTYTQDDGAHHYYIAAATDGGSDSNAGTSSGAPFATWAHALPLLHHGDTLSAKAGDTWSSCFEVNPTVITDSTPTDVVHFNGYGSGALPKITSSCGALGTGTDGGRTAAIAFNGVSGIFVDGLDIGGSGSTTPTQWCVLIENGYSNGGTSIMDTIIIANSKIHGCQVRPGATTAYSSEVFPVGYPLSGPGGVNGPINNVQLINDKFYGETTSAADDNGVDGYPYSNNLTNLLLQGNEFYNLGGRPGALNGTSGNGYVINGWTGALAVGNWAHDIAKFATECGGGTGQWIYSSAFVKITHGESNNVNFDPTVTPGPACDTGGFDIDAFVTFSSIDHVYSHDNYGPAFLYYTNGGGGYGPNSYSDSISVNDQLGGVDGGGVIAANPGSGLTGVNLSIWMDKTAAYRGNGALCWSAGYNGDYSGLNVFANIACVNNGVVNTTYNTFRMVDLGTGATFTTVPKFSHNDYFFNNPGAGATQVFRAASGAFYASLAAYQAGESGQEVGSVAVNPGFVAQGSDPTCGTVTTTGPAPCPPGYGLESTSALVGAGVDYTASPFSLTGMPTTDYYGAAKPNGTSSGYNIGASNASTGLPAPVLQTLGLSPATTTAAAAYTGNFTGEHYGSSISCTSSDSTAVTVGGGNQTLSGTFPSAGTKTETCIETLTGATGSPKTTNITLTVGASLTPTFDPAHTGYGYTLSNSNNTVTDSLGYAADVDVQGNRGYPLTDGLTHIVIYTINAVPTDNYLVFMVAQASRDANANAGVYGASDICALDDGTTYFLPGGTTGSFTGIGGVVVNDTVTLEMKNGKIWIRKNSGNWDGSGTDNPATNTGGLSCSGLTGNMLPHLWEQAQGGQITANFSGW